MEITSAENLNAGSSELDILRCPFLCHFLFGRAKESEKTT